jgi:phage terminase small subunit
MQTKEEVVVVEGCGDGYSEATTVEKKPSLKDVIKAVDTLARMQGVYDNKTTLNICIPVFGGEEDLEE